MFGKVACVVTSKVLGIGDAERAWQAAKRIKSGQWANIGAERTKMQTTLHASTTIQVAKLRRAKREEDGVLWMDEDFAFAKDIRRQQPEGKCWRRFISFFLTLLTHMYAFRLQMNQMV